MSILQDRICGASVADLFAGSGAVGLEALSRGAARVTFVERDRRALSVIERNIRTLGATNETTVVRGDALAHVCSPDSARYDLVLADPPYGQGFAGDLLRCYRRRPFARELWIEHRAGELSPGALRPDIGVKQRKYGDTALTGISLSVP